jgi:molybdenum cofactor synthesis domain-containing protein
MKEGFGKLASLTEARKIIFDLIKENDDEKIRLNKALNRVLAEDIIAKTDVPHFRKSAMDGFAVLAEDTFGASNINPKNLLIIGKSKVGQLPKKELTSHKHQSQTFSLSPGECTEIDTGAPLPKNADAVLMVEYCEKTDHKIILYKAVTPGENIIDIGSDIKKGELLFRKGTVLNPRHIGVLASQGMREILIKKKPQIAYFSTGNELLNLDEELEEGKIYDINSFTIANSIKEQGGEVIFLGVLADNKELIKQKIEEGLQKADFLLLSGGSSLGAEDLMVEAVSELGDILVHGMAVKPGKPVLIGKVKEKLVLGLPGYPTSALADFYILVLPIMEKMLGIRRKTKAVKATLSRKIVSTIGRYEFLPVKLSQDKAIPIHKGSSAITTLAEATGFIEIDENTEILEKGIEVTIRLF